MAKIISFPGTEDQPASDPEEQAEYPHQAGTEARIRNELYLSKKWRVIDDGQQWIIQLLGPGGWKSKSHCRTRRELLRSFAQIGACAEPDSLATIGNLPPTHQGGFGGKAPRS